MEGGSERRGEHPDEASSSIKLAAQERWAQNDGASVSSSIDGQGPILPTKAAAIYDMNLAQLSHYYEHDLGRRIAEVLQKAPEYRHALHEHLPKTGIA
jgi:hypothetical protein